MTDTGDALKANAAQLGRFGHHPDPAIDFCIEVEAIQGQLFDATHGISKPGTEPATIEAVRKRIERAMDFRVGGDETAVAAKFFLRGLEKQTAALSPPVEQSQAAEIARLRDALDLIAKTNQIREFMGDDKSDGYGDQGWVVRDGQYAAIARAALASEGSA